MCSASGLQLLDSAGRFNPYFHKHSGSRQCQGMLGSGSQNGRVLRIVEGPVIVRVLPGGVIAAQPVHRSCRDPAVVGASGVVDPMEENRGCRPGSGLPVYDCRRRRAAADVRLAAVRGVGDGGTRGQRGCQPGYGWPGYWGR